MSLAERSIGFQDLEFQSKSQELLARLNDQHKYLSQKDPLNDVNALLASKDFDEARRFFSDNMYWKEGNYTFSVNLHEVRRRSPYVERFVVRFSKADVDILRENTDKLEALTRYYCASTEEEASNPLPFWNWVTLRINSASK